MEIRFTVNEELSGKTVKQILKNKLNLSERLVKRLKFSEKIFLNSVPIHVNAIVKNGDELYVSIDFEEEADNIVPENIPIDIIYEDEFLIAVNKSPNIVVHPTARHYTGTIANGLMHYFLAKGIKTKIRPVSRLDKDTSGIIIFAKNPYVQEFLIRQIAAGTFSKSYLGIVNGTLIPEKGTIDLPIARNPDSIMLRQVDSNGARAVTNYNVIEQLNNASLVEFQLETGRTHQIRVHCKTIGHPLIGDTLYSDIPTDIINRQALHSYKASFLHPSGSKHFELYQPLPEDMQRVLELLRE